MRLDQVTMVSQCISEYSTFPGELAFIFSGEFCLKSRVFSEYSESIQGILYTIQGSLPRCLNNLHGDGECPDDSADHEEEPVLPVVVEQLGEDDDDEGGEDDAHSLEMELTVNHHLDQLQPFKHLDQLQPFKQLTLNT